MTCPNLLEACNTGGIIHVVLDITHSISTSFSLFISSSFSNNRLSWTEQFNYQNFLRLALSLPFLISSWRLCTCEHVPAVGGIPSQITLAHSALMISWLPEASSVVLTISLSNTVLLPELIVISVMHLSTQFPLNSILPPNAFPLHFPPLGYPWWPWL